MSFNNQQESLSAVMDDEADELELRRVLASIDNVEQRATWARYQVARAAMHKELLLPELDLTKGVNAALDQEAAPSVPAKGAWHTLGRIAIAASVTLAVLAGVRFYHDTQVANQQLASSQPSAPVNVSGSVHEPAVPVGFTDQQQAPAKPALAEESDLIQQEPVQ